MRTLLIMLVASTVAATPIGTVDELDGHWWRQHTLYAKQMYAMGYITASWVWTEGLYVAAQIEHGLTDAVIEVYNTFAPASEGVATEMARELDVFYSRKGNIDIPIYRAVMRLYPVFIHTEGDDS